MKVIWIIDNKFRELYGLFDLKKKLKDHKIKLYLFSIPVWKTAIDLVNPHIVVVPNLKSFSCGPIVEYASQKKINTFVHNSEAMFYDDEVQREKYPIHLIKKISKVLVWSKLDAKFLIKKGFKNKVVVSGNLVFNKNDFIEKKERNKKIKIIGIPTHSRVISGNGVSKNNIPYLIRHFIENFKASRIGLLKFEIDYIRILVKILKEIRKDIRIIIKASPFEDRKIYETTFPKVEIYKGNDVRNFLKNVDLVLNVYSSTAVNALKLNIPVVSLKKLIKWDESILKDRARGPFAKKGPSSLSIQPKDFNELKKLLKKDKKELIRLCKNKNFFKKADELANNCDTLNILTNLFLEYQKKVSPRYKNYFMFLKYILVELRQITFRRKRSKQRFRPWSLEDIKLLKSLRLK